ncbi:unnamed protein product [Paramecium octaurelia]|uniref:Uncharacterized protein n=1 Tax=Paramecium octaurelia TaxID=43137 RepID=A0A8S1Y3I5_PAROT|nr:unnamed protein product [Paramecium octaurelia]
MGVACSGSKRNEQLLLHVDVYIWKEKEKKYHLYDYSSHESHYQQLQLIQDTKLCKYGENILAVQPNQTIEGAQELFVIKERVLRPITDIWSIVRNDQVNGVPVTNRVQLFPGQTIRLGRVKIILWEACFNQAMATEESEKEKDEDPNGLDDSENSNAENSCRICMSKVGTISNPLINPCQCSGSVKYIHIKCLQQWIHNKFKIRELNNIVLYFWSNLICEICKEQYKLEYKFKNRKYHLIDIPRPKEAYFIFWISHIDKNKEKGLYVINLNGRTNIKIGRVQENDIKLQDISVSRNHALITFNREDESIYLEDLGSKFGTLLQIDQLKLDCKSIIQVANSVFIFDYLKKNQKHYELPSFYKVVEKETQQQPQDFVEDDVLVNVDNNKYLSGDNEAS